MEKKERYEFDPTKAYQLVAITDHNRNDKVHTKYFYASLMNCTATNFEYDEEKHIDGYRLYIHFVQNEKGMPVDKPLHTSLLHRVEETEDGLRIHTRKSIYVFKETELKEVSYQDEASLIELFLSADETYYFNKGRYYDEEKEPHELTKYVHLGMVKDSVLIFAEGNPMDTVCRFFPNWREICFYDSIPAQQDYSVPMLLHNTGSTSFQVRFERYPKVWTIKPGESKKIIPFTPDDADKEN